MSILVDKQTRVICQGITGRAGEFHSKNCLDYGTQLVAGVTPGKGGEQVHGIPVYDTVAQLKAIHSPTVTIISVPAPARNPVTRSVT